jgi:sortase A
LYPVNETKIVDDLNQNFDAVVAAFANETDQPDSHMPEVVEDPAARIETPDNAPIVIASVPAVQPPTVTGNRVVIPKIGVDITISEGTVAKTALNAGAWRIPNTSKPGVGNTVLAAHRYLHKPPRKDTFFNLDKMAVGDEFQVHWNGQPKNYAVTEVRIVNPDQLEILNNTDHEQITLMTCTPLYTSKQRLLVIGRPV